MKGSIFTLFEKFVTEHYGDDAYDDLLDATELETTEPFVGPETYPAGDMVALLTTASAHTGRSVEDLLRAFGRFAFPVLAGSVPALMEGLGDARQFLLGFEAVIHAEVRKLDPMADPPRFTVVEHGPNELEVHYESSLGLFALAEGLLDGLADWYQTPFTHERTGVAGTNCTFLVDLAPAAAAASGTDASSTTSALAGSPADR